MKEELQKQLQTKYPNLINESLDIDCGDGWYNLLDETLNILKHEIEHKHVECHILQIKEKFGGLRFYMNGGDTFTDGVICLAESMSYHICDVCGNVGKAKNKGGWARTRCEEHGE